jgi:hypothetical protein
MQLVKLPTELKTQEKNSAVTNVCRRKKSDIMYPQRGYIFSSPFIIIRTSPGREKMNLTLIFLACGLRNVSVLVVP